jgi:putative ABC transport system permease protein
MNWIRRVFQKSQAEKSLDKELQFHLDRQISDYVAAGVQPAEARRRARLEFGTLDRVKEGVRDTRWERHLDNLFRDFRYAIRNLRKDRRFAFVAIFALALGIGASTVVFSTFYNLLFNAFTAKDASRLVVPVVQNTEKVERSQLDSDPLYCHLSDLDQIREQNHVFENITGYSGFGMVLIKDGLLTYQLYDARVTANSFEFYGVPPLLGRGITSEDGKPGAPPIFVMSYKTWKNTFQEDLKILGRSFTVDGELRTLVGVMPARFQAFGALDQIWIPFTWTNGTTRSDRDPTVTLLARLKRGVTTEAASAELDIIAKRLAKVHPDDFPKHFTARVMSATDFFMRPSPGGVVFRTDIKHLLYDMLAAVTMLLLIACSNVANLLLARATLREKEMAVRSALGATRGRLISQLLIESSALAIAACLAGCVFAWFGTKGVEAVMHQKTWSNIRGEAVIGLNPQVLLFALGVTLLTTLVCGIAPALRAGRVDLQPHLAGSTQGTTSSSRHGKFRAGLVISEVALSVVLLIGAGLIMRSFVLITHVELGFNPKNVLVMAIAPPRGHDQTPDRAKISSPQWQATLKTIAARLKTLPGVEDVAVNNTLPGYGPSRGPQVTVPGSPRSEEAGLDECDESCVRVLGLHLIKGRWLSKQEVDTTQHVAVISQRLARDFFGDGDPVGQQLMAKPFKGMTRISEDTYFQIIGVVGDVKNAGLQNPAVPMAFIPPLITGAYVLQIKTRVEPASLMHAVQEQVWAVDRDEVFWVFDPLPDFLQSLTYATPELAMLISAPIASISLLLVIIGVFSVMAYSVSLRIHEFGIRMTLGAQRRDILRMVIREGLGLISVGSFLGLFASCALTRFLTTQIWGVSATDPWTFVAVVIMLLFVGLVACLLPARRAAGVDPLVALRYE